MVGEPTDGVKVRLGQEWVTFLVENDASSAPSSVSLPLKAVLPTLSLSRISLIVIRCALVVLLGFISCEVPFLLV